MAKKFKIKTFRLPLDEGTLNALLNRETVTIIDKKVFQDKSGDITVYVEYEEDTREGGTNLW